MSSRIGTLHVRYRARANGTLAAAMAPHLDRVLVARLGDAIDARLSASLGDDSEVVVIRQLHARVAITRADWSLDGRVVEKIGRASVDAIAATLSSPATADSIVRFADQAEFVGSFILDLLAGSAWERWYYGAFERYRQSDAATTIGAVLEDNRAHVVAVFGWLQRRGQLDAVLGLLGSERARLLASGLHVDLDAPSAAQEMAPLLAAAFQLLEALGWSAGDETTRARLVAEYLANTPLPPTWTDRRSLSAWTLRFVGSVVDDLLRRKVSRATSRADSAHTLLSGPLDWLDATWLLPQLEHLARDPSSASAAPAQSMRRVLTSRHEDALARLAEIVRRGRVPIDTSEGRDRVAVRLLAATNEGEAGATSQDRAVIAVIERIAAAFCAAAASGLDGQLIMMALAGGGARRIALPGGHEVLARHLEGVRAMGPAPVTVLQQLVNSTIADVAGDETAAGGLFLLTRGLLDVKLHALARGANVPFEPLKGALAAWWLDLTPPFDGAATAWIGDARPRVCSLEAPGARLGELEEALFEVMRNQRAAEALPSDDLLELEPARGLAMLECSGRTRASVARIGWMVLRAWSRWLPGVGGSRRPFLVRNCLQRGAHVRVSSTEIAVRLDPAPLDVVLEMAGYFRPIELVPWLDRRAITFSVRRSARM